ncbi:MAG: UDP-N-acetylmuramoyl-L-alanine--D-glutamate ligase [Gammaproteobacteria bacterium]
MTYALTADISAPQLEQFMTAQRVMVVGMGITGVSCARSLASQGVHVCFADSRSQPPALDAIRSLYPDAELLTGELPASVPEDVDKLIVSPGVRLDSPLLKNAQSRGIEVLSDIDLFVDQCDVPLLLVTGTNGKSTVTSLVASILRSAGYRAEAGGNLGTAALDLLDTDAEAFVLELSSFQLERSKPIPSRAAVVLNIAADHIDYHGSLKKYVAAKQRIYSRCDLAIVNRDEPDVVALVTSDVPVVTFGLDAPLPGHWGIAAIDGDEFIVFGDEPVIPVSRVRLEGRHNLANVLAAMAFAAAMDVPFSVMAEAAALFDGLSHRMELVVEYAGVRWIDDSKATNESAATASINSVAGPLILIAGGDAKGADFARLAEALRGRESRVVLLGKDAEKLAAVLQGVAEQYPVQSIEEAVVRAAELAEAGTTVLLAPACSSLDMFVDFRDRGQQFAAAVKRVVQ